MGRWLIVLMHCTNCNRDHEYTWDQTYEDLRMINCPDCERANMERRTGVGARVMNRALPDGTNRGAEYDRMKRLANLTCELGEHFEGTAGRKDVEAEIKREGGSVSKDVAFTT